MEIGRRKKPMIERGNDVKSADFRWLDLIDGWVLELIGASWVAFSFVFYRSTAFEIQLVWFNWFKTCDWLDSLSLSLSLSLSHLSVLLGNGRVWINSMVIIELIIRWRISSRMTFKRERERERDEKEMLAERLIQISRWTKQISTSSMLSTLLASMVDIWRRHIARSALFFLKERQKEREKERRDLILSIYIWFEMFHFLRQHRNRFLFWFRLKILWLAHNCSIKVDFWSIGLMDGNSDPFKFWDTVRLGDLHHQVWFN